MKKLFKDISVRGRMAYALLCLERIMHLHGATSHPSNFILDKLWEFVRSDKLDEWIEEINELTPESINECKPSSYSTYEYIETELAESIWRYFNTYPQDLIQSIDISMSIGMKYIYGSIPSYGKETIDLLKEINKICVDNNIVLPDATYFTKYPFAIKSGWGDSISKVDEIYLRLSL